MDTNDSEGVMWAYHEHNVELVKEIERLKKERDQAIKVGGIMITGPAGLRNATGHWFHKNDGIAELFVHLKEKENG